jgi:hypothetical protein
VQGCQLDSSVANVEILRSLRRRFGTSLLFTPCMATRLIPNISECVTLRSPWHASSLLTPTSPLASQALQFIKLCRDCQIMGTTLSEANPPLMEADIQVRFHKMGGDSRSICLLCTACWLPLPLLRPLLPECCAPRAGHIHRGGEEGGQGRPEDALQRLPDGAHEDQRQGVPIV